MQIIKNIISHCKSDFNETKIKVIVEDNEKQESNLLKISNKSKIPMSFIVGRLAKVEKISYKSNLYNKYRKS